MGELILNPRRNSSGEPDVEPASYDLRAGIVLWKDKASKNLKTIHFLSDQRHQEVVTLAPGQMVFVITHEELRLPCNVCGTVYSRNRLQKKNILALNAGHVDPGYTGPIIIRLINLGQGEWPLPLGDSVFTAVFHTLESGDADCDRLIRTKDVTLLEAQETAAQAFSNPLHDLYTDELDKHFARHDQDLETRLRRDFAGEFYRKKETQFLVAEIAVGVVVLLALVVKLPWGDVWQWLHQVWFK